jgi:hypothetical protein
VNRVPAGKVDSRFTATHAMDLKLREVEIDRFRETESVNRTMWSLCGQSAGRQPNWYAM